MVTAPIAVDCQECGSHGDGIVIGQSSNVYHQVNIYLAFSLFYSFDVSGELHRAIFAFIGDTRVLPGIEKGDCWLT